jgi:MoaA/NifB/PqqE/SkfB family radical SAM enzyme
MERSSGTFNTALEAIERCQRLGVDTSIAMALMNHNYKYLPEFKKLIDRYHISLRMNIFKPIQNNDFELSYSQFWEAMEILSENFKVVSISEPILSTVTEIDGHGSPCGGSLRIHPDLNVTGCVYLAPGEVDVDEFNEQKGIYPEFCIESKCPYAVDCMGGCFGRRIYKVVLLSQTNTVHLLGEKNHLRLSLRNLRVTQILSMQDISVPSLLTNGNRSI